MSRRIDGIGKQGVNPRPTEFARRQTDPMNDDQVRGQPRWAIITIGRGLKARCIQQARGLIDPHDQLQHDMAEIKAHIGMRALQDEALHIVNTARPQHWQGSTVFDAGQNRGYPLTG